VTTPMVKKACKIAQVEIACVHRSLVTSAIIRTFGHPKQISSVKQDLKIVFPGNCSAQIEVPFSVFLKADH